MLTRLIYLFVLLASGLLLGFFRLFTPEITHWSLPATFECSGSAVNGGMVSTARFFGPSMLRGDGMARLGNAQYSEADPNLQIFLSAYSPMAPTGSRACSMGIPRSWLHS